MSYVQRNKDGLIIAVFARKQIGLAEEFVENAALDEQPPALKDYAAAVQDMLDGEARALGYGSVASAVSYADEPAVPKFQAEGQAMRARRSLAWQYAYATLADVGAGNVPQPTIGEFIAGVPA